MKSMLLATALLTLSVGAAFAGEGNGNPFPFNANGPVTANIPLVAAEETGQTPMMFKMPPNSVSYGRTAMATAIGHYRTVTATTGEVLPTNGSQGVVQTANSLPVGFENGTVAYEQYASVQRYLAQQDAASAQRAFAHAAQPGNGG